MVAAVVAGVVLVAGGLVAYTINSGGDRKEKAEANPPAAKPGPAAAAKPGPKAAESPAAPKVDPKAGRLAQIDREVMDAFRAGRRSEGLEKLLDAIKPYQKADPGDCKPEEALAVAVLYARTAAIFGKSLPEEKLLAYTSAVEVYAIRGGVRGADRGEWFEKIVRETLAAYGKN